MPLPQKHQPATFDPAELAVVLSYYDLGVIESITRFARGSSRSPKVGIVSERGKFLLKRRAAERAHPGRVRFSHWVQTHLAAAGFPLARLIPTRRESETLVQLKEHIYELFAFVAGEPYQRSAEEALDGGEVLAKFHNAAEGFVVPERMEVPHGGYHDASGVRTGLCSIGSMLSSHESLAGNEGELTDLLQFLLHGYNRAADAANRLGLSAQPDRIVHMDWHPGNLLFRKQRVVAVIDYDSVRQSRTALDTANGALQFSILAGGDPAAWPDELDEERFYAFLDGYESVHPLSEEERLCLPHLMIESLISECVPPIARTGTVGRWAGFRILQMVRRKVTWLDANAERLISAGRTRAITEDQ